VGSVGGLLKVLAGIAGMFLALALSVAGSGRDEALEPYTVVFNSNSRGLTAKMLGLSLDRSYTNVTVELVNRGSSLAHVTIGSFNVTLAPSQSVSTSISDLLNLMEVSFVGGGGLLEARVYAVARVNVNPLLSIAALIVLLLSMVVAGYGLVEYILSRGATLVR